MVTLPNRQSSIRSIHVEEKVADAPLMSGVGKAGALQRRVNRCFINETNRGSL